VRDDRPADRAGLESRARAAVIALTPAALAGERWSGLRAGEIGSIELLDTFAFQDGGALAVLVVRLATDPNPVRLTLPLEGPPPWPGLERLAATGGEVPGVLGGHLAGRPARPAESSPGDPWRASTFRQASGDQSHTSVILDERRILKLYRRLPAGPNPEAELLAVLPPEAPVPAWQGAVDMVFPDGSSTAVAAMQAFVPDALDAFEVLAEGLSAWLAGDEPEGDGPALVIPAGTGTAAGRLHRALSAMHGPGFEVLEATAADRAAWLAAADQRLAAAIGVVRDVDPAMADRLDGAAPAIRRAFRPLGDPAIPVRLTRIHGDLHLGQVLATPRGILLVDFEGDPMLPPAARGLPAPPLRDVAAFLRSLDHVTQSGQRRARLRRRAAAGGAVTGDAARAAARVAAEVWLGRAREAFLAAYATALGEPGWTPDRALLRAMEVDKEVGELVYAATFLPAWRYAPAGGMRALLGVSLEGE
jgi:maltokinase